ncbi:hypothetical protein ACP4OV_009141 [Aristida adscensionis]
MTVDVEEDCLCLVSEAAEFHSRSDLSVAQIWRWYETCGGRRPIPEDEDSCHAGSPPPPPPAAKPEEPSAWPVGLCIAVGVVCAGAIITIIVVALIVWLRQVSQNPQHEATPCTLPTSNPVAVSVTQRAGEDDADNALFIVETSGGPGEEEEASPSVDGSPLHGLRRGEEPGRARVRLPAPTPFEPLPPPVHQDQLYEFVKVRSQWRQGTACGSDSAAACGSETDPCRSVQLEDGVLA